MALPLIANGIRLALSQVTKKGVTAGGLIKRGAKSIKKSPLIKSDKKITGKVASKKEQDSNSISESLGMAGSISLSSKINKSNQNDAQPISNNIDGTGSIKSVLDVAIQLLYSISETIKEQNDLEQQNIKEEYYETRENIIEKNKKKGYTEAESDATRIEEKESMLGSIASLLTPFVAPLLTVLGGIAAVVGSIIGLSSEAEAKTPGAPRKEKHPNTKKQDGTPVKTSANDTGDFTNVKSLIRKAESNNNPDAIHGPRGAPTTGKKQFGKSLTEMTIREVYNSTKGLADRDGKGGSSGAAGLYQIIPPTLKDLMTKKGHKAHHGLDWSDKFSVKNQNLLANTLLAKKQKIKKTDSENQIINKLANEWAGMPTTSGRSKYGGVQGNKANVKLSSVRNAIRNDKNDIRPQIRAENNREFAEAVDDVKENPTLDNIEDLGSTGFSALISNLKGLAETDTVFRPLDSEFNKMKSNMIDIKQINHDNKKEMMPKSQDIKAMTASERLQAVNSGSLDVINPNYKMNEDSIISHYLKSFNMTGNLAA